LAVKLIDIKIDNIQAVTTKVKKGDNPNELIGVIQIEAPVNPGVIARLLNLQKQGVPIYASISTDQLCFDLTVTEVNNVTGEIRD
jgi:hypothetical protein